MLQTVRIIVSGKVQGVYYRQSTYEKAVQLAITGSVRNLPDNRVEILATGTGAAIDQLITWCHIGPPRARVTGVEVISENTIAFSNFTIAR